MSFSLTNIVNRFINVRNKVKDADGNWVDQKKPRETLRISYESRISVVDDNVDITVFSNWSKRIIIDSLSLGTNTNSHPVLWGRQEDVGESFNGNIFVTTTTSGGGSSSWPKVLHNVGGYNDYLDLVSWDKDTRYALIVLRKPVILPHGAELRIRSSEGYTGELSYKVVWREIEE